MENQENGMPWKQREFVLGESSVASNIAGKSGMNSKSVHWIWPHYCHRGWANFPPASILWRTPTEEETRLLGPKTQSKGRQVCMRGVRVWDRERNRQAHSAKNQLGHESSKTAKLKRTIQKTFQRGQTPRESVNVMQVLSLWTETLLSKWTPLEGPAHRLSNMWLSVLGRSFWTAASIDPS